MKSCVCVCVYIKSDTSKKMIVDVKTGVNWEERID